MAEFHLIKNIAQGLFEYTACQALAEGDTLFLEFNKEVTIDDIALRKSDSSTYFNIFFLYPASAQKGYLLNDVSIPNEWFLNGAQNNAGKRWYHLPARTKLAIQRLQTGSTVVHLTVLGRSG
jgi:hypothetical protein